MPSMNKKVSSNIRRTPDGKLNVLLIRPLLERHNRYRAMDDRELRVMYPVIVRGVQFFHLFAEQDATENIRLVAKRLVPAKVPGMNLNVVSVWNVGNVIAHIMARGELPFQHILTFWNAGNAGVIVKPRQLPGRAGKCAVARGQRAEGSHTS